MESASTYWERLAEETEAAAQRVAANRQRYVRQVYREAQASIKVSVDALYAQILDKGADTVTRAQLWQYSKYQSLLRQIETSVATIRTAQDAVVEQTIRKVFEDTIGTTLDAAIGKGRWSHPTQAIIDQYLVTPWSGERYSTRIWRNANKLGTDMRKHMEDMLVLGKSPGAVKQQLMRDFGVSYEIADRLVMTETSNAYNTAALEGYRSAGVKQVRWVLGPAEGQCERCRTYAYEQGGIYDIDDAPHIPVHPRCRCRWVAVVDIKARTAQIRDQMLHELQAEGLPVGQHGAYSGARLYEDDPEAEAHAQRYYASVRKMTTDVSKIANNTGWKKRDVAAVKRHIFMEEHVIYGQKQRFAPSYEMAQSWQRLIDGKDIRDQDIILLNHELMELRSMRKGLSFEAAHEQASKAFDFEQYVQYSR